MLYASLVCSGTILVAAFVAARYSKNPARATIGWAVAIAVLPLAFLMMAFPAVWLQTAILVGALFVAGVFGYATRLVVPLSVVAGLAAYGVVGYSALQEQKRYDELRAQFPFESIEGRVPGAVPPSMPGDDERLTRLEEVIERESGRRNYNLEWLHRATVNKFVDSSGFGAARMVRFNPTEERLKGEPRPDAPEQGDYFRLAPKETDKLPARPELTKLGKLHEDGFLDFVNPKGFGYVKSRREVAGFQSHGFSKVPDPAGEWRVASLELVGILRHDNPVVYVSNKLPKMDELQEAKTRPLDSFETAALKALRDGADLHTGEGPDVRFLGAIRSTKQCAECHGSKRGDLLGAFTYRLTPVGR